MSTDRLQPYEPDLPEPYATLHHDDGYFATKRREETRLRPFRTEVYAAEQVRAILADAHAHYEAQVRPLVDLAKPSAPAWWNCRIHGRPHPSEWGCPQCVRELREDVRKLGGLAQPEVIDAEPFEATDEMIDAACAAVPGLYRVDAMRAIEAAWRVAQTAGDAARPAEPAAELTADEALAQIEGVFAEDASCPVVAHYTDWPGKRVYANAPHGWDEPGLHLTEEVADYWTPLIRRRDLLAALAAKDEIIAGLEADLIEERRRIASMREEFGEEAATLTARARHAEDVVDAAKECIAALDGALAAKDAHAHELLGSFKNFHRSLCARFGYTHDEVDWDRDRVSLEEFIASKLSTAEARALAEEAEMDWVLRHRARVIETHQDLPVYMHYWTDRECHGPDAGTPRDAVRAAMAQQQEQKHG